MSITAKASIHVKPCKIVQSEQHNRRDMEYLNSLDPTKLYIRTDLMHLNESYVAPGMEGVSLQQLYDSIKAMVKEKTGRAMQEKDVEFTDKKGKKRVRQGCSPIRESVVNIKPDTTMDDLLRYAERVQERWGVKAVQIHIHKDEGHYENVQDPATWKPNLHAHIIWDWMNHSTGKSYKLNADDMSEMQDMVAETLAMERGRKKSETGVDHLERNDFILQKQREEQERLQEETEKALAKKKAAETQAAEAEKQKAAAEQQTAAAKEEKAQAEQQASAAKEQLDSIEEQTKAKEDAIAVLDERITNKTRKDNTLAAGLIQKTHQDKVLTTEIQSKRKSVRSLDRDIENKSGILDELDEEISEKEETKSGLDAAIATKKETIAGLDADIQTKTEAVEKLKVQEMESMRESFRYKSMGDWQDGMFRGMAGFLYNQNETIRFCVDAITDFALSCTKGRGGHHGDIFWDNESTAIKNVMEFFSKFAETTMENVGHWLVWMAGVGHQLNKWETKQAEKEVNDIAIGRYDGRIRRYQNKGGGMKR